MSVLNRNPSIVKSPTTDAAMPAFLRGKLPTTDTADVRSLRHVGAGANGHGNGGNGHRHRPRHQIRNGYRRTALKGDNAVMLAEAGMPVTEAIERCDTNTADFAAMKAVRESGHTSLHKRVMLGIEPVRPSGRLVKNAAAAITALQKCSPFELALVQRATSMTNDPVSMLRNLSADELTVISQKLGSAWLWDHMVIAALSAKTETTESNVS
jgi:hypothetical protein